VPFQPIERYQRMVFHDDWVKTTTTGDILFYTGVTTKLVGSYITALPQTGRNKSKGAVLLLLLLLLPVSGRCLAANSVNIVLILLIPGHVDFTIGGARSMRVSLHV
jgi:translation elongation factor EF-G